MNNKLLSMKFLKIIFFSNKSADILAIFPFLYSMSFFSFSFSISLYCGYIFKSILEVVVFCKPTSFPNFCLFSFVSSLGFDNISWYNCLLFWIISFVFWRWISLLSIINIFDFFFDLFSIFSSKHTESSHVDKLARVFECLRLIIEFPRFFSISLFLMKSTKNEFIFSIFLFLWIFISSSLLEFTFLFVFWIFLFSLFLNSGLDACSFIWGLSPTFIFWLLESFVSNLFMESSTKFIRKWMSEFSVKTSVDVCGYFSKIYGFIIYSHNSDNGLSKAL